MRAEESLASMRALLATDPICVTRVGDDNDD